MIDGKDLMGVTVDDVFKSVGARKNECKLGI
jgi:hypothetical protein